MTELRMPRKMRVGDRVLIKDNYLLTEGPSVERYLPHVLIAVNEQQTTHAVMPFSVTLVVYVFVAAEKGVNGEHFVIHFYASDLVDSFANGMVKPLPCTDCGHSYSEHVIRDGYETIVDCVPGCGCGQYEMDYPKVLTRGELFVADTFEITGRGTSYVVVAFDPPLVNGDHVLFDGVEKIVTGVERRGSTTVTNGHQAILVKDAAE